MELQVHKLVHTDEGKIHLNVLSDVQRRNETETWDKEFEFEGTSLETPRTDNPFQCDVMNQDEDCPLQMEIFEDDENNEDESESDSDRVTFKGIKWDMINDGDNLRTREQIEINDGQYRQLSVESIEQNVAKRIISTEKCELNGAILGHTEGSWEHSVESSEQHMTSDSNNGNQNATNTEVKCMRCVKMCKSASDLKDHLHGDVCVMRCQYYPRVLLSQMKVSNEEHYTFLEHGEAQSESLNVLDKSSDHDEDDDEATKEEEKRPVAKYDRYKCTVCGKELNKRWHLNEHMRIHTKERPEKCHLCDKTFVFSSALRKHLRTIHNDFSKKRRTQLTRHLPSDSMKAEPKKKVTRSGQYKCTVCGKGNNTSVYLRLHMRVHINERPEKCHLCDKQYRFRSALSTHLRKVHVCSKTGRSILKKPPTNPDQYKCTVCDKELNNSWHLKEHMRRHTKERPEKCHLCDKTFVFSSALRKHLRTIHNEFPKTLRRRLQRESSDSNSIEHLSLHSIEGGTEGKEKRSLPMTDK